MKLVGSMSQRNILTNRMKIYVREIKRLRVENAKLHKQVQENEDLRFKAMLVSSPLTDLENLHWPESCYVKNKYRWWESFCPNCKRPLDVSFIPVDEQEPETIVGPDETELPPASTNACAEVQSPAGWINMDSSASSDASNCAQEENMAKVVQPDALAITKKPSSMEAKACEGPDSIPQPSTNFSSNSECKSWLFWLRNGTLVKPLWPKDEFDWKTHYEVVSSPIHWCRPGRTLSLSHEDTDDPLSHRGGELGMGFDVVAQALDPRSPPPRSRAYVAALWGSQPGLVLGALVLGRSLRRSGTKYDLVLLVTADVPKSSMKILAMVWKLELVPYVDAAAGLSVTPGNRFEGVFTKLHALGLVDYEKVLMLDLDLAIIQCPDELFELRAPAAMSRTIGGRPLHGYRLNGRHFFCGAHVAKDSSCLPWCQGGGINAGVMLLRPDTEEHQRAIGEVTAEVHPERIPGAGPEQDYLSRFYAPWWSHISVAWNYQLHRVFHGLSIAHDFLLKASNEDELWVPERVEMDVNEIKIVHFSGEIKMWDLKLELERDDASYAAFAEQLLLDCSPVAAWCLKCLEITSNQTRVCEESNEESDEDNDYMRMLRSDPRQREVVQRTCDKARSAALVAVKQWFADFDGLQVTFPDLPSRAELLKLLFNPSWPTDCPYERDDRVWAWCSASHRWCEGAVVSANEDRHRLNIQIDDAGSGRKVLRNLPYTWMRPLDYWGEHVKDEPVGQVVAPICIHH